MRKITTYKGVELLVPEKGEKHPNAGRPKGAKNVMTRVLKDAILRAAAKSKHAKGGGLAGYLKDIADNNKECSSRSWRNCCCYKRKNRPKLRINSVRRQSRRVFPSTRSMRARNHRM
jgi:hypothetical protein